MRSTYISIPLPDSQTNSNEALSSPQRRPHNIRRPAGLATTIRRPDVAVPRILVTPDVDNADAPQRPDAGRRLRARGEHVAPGASHHQLDIESASQGPALRLGQDGALQRQPGVVVIGGEPSSTRRRSRPRSAEVVREPVPRRPIIGRQGRRGAGIQPGGGGDDEHADPRVPRGDPAGAG